MDAQTGRTGRPRGARRPADGEPLEPSRPAWSVPAGGPHEVVCLGRVPSGAAAYQLQLGYDAPDIVKGNVVTVSDVRLAVLDGVARGASGRDADDLRPRVKLLTPSPTRDAHVPVRLALDGDFDIDWPRLKVLLDGTDATERFVRTSRLRACAHRAAAGRSSSISRVGDGSAFRTATSCLR